MGGAKLRAANSLSRSGFIFRYCQLAQSGEAWAPAAKFPKERTQQERTQPTKPNIVFMLADKLGYGELGVYGGGILRGAPIPRIDALASEGMHPAFATPSVGRECTLVGIAEFY
jgi:hypothetical protein